MGAACAEPVEAAAGSAHNLVFYLYLLTKLHYPLPFLLPYYMVNPPQAGKPAFADACAELVEAGYGGQAHGKAE